MRATYAAWAAVAGCLLGVALTGSSWVEHRIPQRSRSRRWRGFALLFAATAALCVFRAGVAR